MNDYSAEMKRVRAKLGLNTKQFGERMGVSHKTIEDWEQGRRKRLFGPAAILLELLRREADSTIESEDKS